MIVCAMVCCSREGQSVPLLLTSCIREIESRGLVRFIFCILDFSNAKSYASAVHAVIILFVYALVCRLQLYAALREANIKLFVILVSLTWSLWPSPDSYSWFNKRSWFPTSVSLFLGNQSIFYMSKVWNTNKKSIFLTISYYYEWSLV